MLSKQRGRIGRHVIGLDIGSHAVKGVEITEEVGEQIIKSAGSVVIGSTSPDDAATVHAVKSLWHDAHFETNEVVLSLPAEAVHLKWLNLEPASEDELDAMARTTAARGAPFPASDAVLDYRILSTQTNGSRKVYFAMLAAASASAIDRLLDLAGRAGLQPVGVDLGISAALRSLMRRDENRDMLWGGQPKAHCVIGARSTVIAVVRDCQLEFCRMVPVGGNDFTQAIADELAVDWEIAEHVKIADGVRINDQDVVLAVHHDREARISCSDLVDRLAREVNRSLRFFSSQFAEGSFLGMIGSITLSGGGSLLRGLDTCLRRKGIEATSVSNPFSGFAVDAGGSGVEHVAGQYASFTTAVGLAISDHGQQSNPALSKAA